MKKKLVSLGIATSIMLSQSINIFASDNTVSSEHKINIEQMKAAALGTVISNPTTIVNYNGNQYSKGDKNSIDEKIDINYKDVDATVVNTIIVSPKTIVDINIPLADKFKPVCFDKFNK